MKNRLNKKVFILTVRKLCIVFMGFCIVSGAVPADVIAAVETTYLYKLSNFSGPVPFSWANIFFDEEKNEIYVVDPRGRDIRIFNEKGMEIYRFGDDGSLGTVADVAVDRDGNILVLSRRHLKSAIILCNFRGEELSELKLKNLPPDFSRFSPDRIIYRNGQIYLLDSFSMRIALTDASGRFQKAYDLAALLDVEEKKRGDTDICGFSIDRQGNILFTVPVLFSAYTLSPDGKTQGFGHPGSAPGKFNIVGDIVADERGFYYVADRLKCVVLIFDKDFQFQTQFGYRGLRPDNLIGPRNLALDSLGRLYVSQRKSRGISVFKIVYD